MSVKMSQSRGTGREKCKGGKEEGREGGRDEGVGGRGEIMTERER